MRVSFIRWTFVLSLVLSITQVVDAKRKDFPKPGKHLEYLRGATWIPVYPSYFPPGKPPKEMSKEDTFKGSTSTDVIWGLIDKRNNWKHVERTIEFAVKSGFSFLRVMASYRDWSHREAQRRRGETNSAIKNFKKLLKLFEKHKIYMDLTFYDRIGSEPIELHKRGEESFRGWIQSPGPALINDPNWYKEKGKKFVSDFINAGKDSKALLLVDIFNEHHIEDNYIKLIVNTAETIKSIAPHILVFNGGAGIPDDRFSPEIFWKPVQTILKDPNIDGGTIHPYGGPASTLVMVKAAERMTSKEFLGKDKLVFSNEVASRFNADQPYDKFATLQHPDYFVRGKPIGAGTFGHLIHPAGSGHPFAAGNGYYAWDEFKVYDTRTVELIRKLASRDEGDNIQFETYKLLKENQFENYIEQIFFDKNTGYPELLKKAKLIVNSGPGFLNFGPEAILEKYGFIRILIDLQALAQSVFIVTFSDMITQEQKEELETKYNLLRQSNVLEVGSTPWKTPDGTLDWDRYEEFYTEFFEFLVELSETVDFIGHGR